MNLLELGLLLKQERERRGLSLRDVMDSTKISRRNLNALEEGEVKLLPHPVYLKGYVRNYARLVGLDADPLVAVVDQQSDGDTGYLPQQQVSGPVSAPAPAAPAAQQPATVQATDVSPAEAQPAPQAFTPAPEPAPAPTPEAATEPEPAPAGEPEGSFESQIRFSEPAALERRPRRLWPLLLLVVFAAALAGVVYQYQRIQAEEPPVAALLPAENATNATAGATAEADVNATDANATLPEANATLPEPVAAPASPGSAPASTGASAMPEFKPGAPTATPASGASVATSGIEVSRKGQQPSSSAPAAPAPAEVRTLGMQELVVIGKPGEICWVEVSEGQRRKTFTLRDGESRRFEFSQKAKVRLGNAGGVTFQLNGAHYPFEGQRGQTASFEIGN